MLAETCSECNYVIICKRLFGCYRGKVFVFYFVYMKFLSIVTYHVMKTQYNFKHL
jgi:hypothetical protein